MTTERRNEASKFEYLDPLEILTDLDAYRRAVNTVSENLSAHDRKKLVEEIPQAAVFSAGMSQLWRRPVIFSPGERLGSDAVLAIGGEHARWLHICQIQRMKVGAPPQNGFLGKLPHNLARAVVDDLINDRRGVAVDNDLIGYGSADGVGVNADADARVRHGDALARRQFGRDRTLRRLAHGMSDRRCNR